MEKALTDFLIKNDINLYPEYISLAILLASTLLIGVLLYYVAYVITRKVAHSIIKRVPLPFVQMLCETRIFVQVNYLAVSVGLAKVATILFANQHIKDIITVACNVWTTFCLMFIAFSVLDTFTRWSSSKKFAQNFPVRGAMQTVKLLFSIGTLLIVTSTIIGKSPLVLLSGLGAMTAVLMLVFKDPILGLVAGVQLSANNMLKVGDWLEMPKHNADGEVIDINLTTVKVKNWDNTITTIPTYSLISDSFKNWRSMSESGGRRIKRAINIDISSVKFITKADVEKFTKSHLLSEYIVSKSHELEEANKAADMSLTLNGRRLTNLGTLRAYLQRYLQNHPKIHKGMTLMVRQLAPTNDGVPLEIYCFTNDVAWVNYEGIQADIFDHIFAVIKEFDLRVHQSPTGDDIRSGIEKISQKGLDI